MLKKDFKIIWSSVDFPIKKEKYFYMEIHTRVMAFVVDDVISFPDIIDCRRQLIASLTAIYVERIKNSYGNWKNEKFHIINVKLSV